MKLGRSLLVLGFLLMPALTHANDFGVLRTAIPVEKSVWRFGAGGIVSLEDNGREAFSVCAERGLNAKSDIAAKLSFSGDDAAIGGALTYLIKRSDMDFPLDLSAQGGLHYVNHDQNDAFVVDLTLLGSKEIKPKLSVYGAFDLGFGNQDVPAGFDGSYTTVGLVPGVSYELTDKVNVAFELGLGLNDSATNYIAGLLRYSLKR
jgi:hypothetical protein